MKVCWLAAGKEKLNCRGSLIPVVFLKKDSCPTNSRQEVSRVKNLKITSPESECLVSPNFPWPGKGSWENQISSGEAASVSEVGLDQSSTLGNAQERSSRLTKKEK